MEVLQAVNEFIVNLYRHGRDVPVARFRHWALEQLREVIDFDSAMWGAGSESPQTINSVYLYRQPKKMIDEYVRDGWQAHDTLRAACAANPGKSINFSDLVSTEQWHRTPLYRHYARKYGIEWALCTVQVESYSSLNAFISLWRNDPARPFAEQDRRRKQVLVPHLIEALHANQLWLFSSAGSHRKAATQAMAICDDTGRLHLGGRGFSQLLRAEWPEWSGALLPQRLTSALAVGRFRGRRIDIDIENIDDRWLLRAQDAQAVRQLGARELKAAGLYAQGFTYRQIAEKMSVSPATVRNQLRRSFAKLGVASKVELARRLDELDRT